MGSLKPGATYIYERVDDVVYAREQGAPPESRVAVGWDYDPANNPGLSKIRHEFLWSQIFDQLVKTLPKLNALDASSRENFIFNKAVQRGGNLEAIAGSTCGHDLNLGYKC